MRTLEDLGIIGVEHIEVVGDPMNLVQVAFARLLISEGDVTLEALVWPPIGVDDEDMGDNVPAVRGSLEVSAARETALEHLKAIHHTLKKHLGDEEDDGGDVAEAELGFGVHRGHCRRGQKSIIEQLEAENLSRDHYLSFRRHGCDLFEFLA